MKKYLKLIYRISFIIICGLGIGFHFDFYDGDYNTHAFSFFTVQSNIFCLIVVCLLVIRQLQGTHNTGRFFIYFYGMSLSAILCAALIYHFAEGRIRYPMFTGAISSIPPGTLFAHYIIPPLYFLDWFLFYPKGMFRKSYTIKWLAFPFVYFVSFLIRCGCNPISSFFKVKKFPYFFLDYETLGIPNFLGYIVMIMLIMIFINIILIFFDNFLMKHQKVLRTQREFPDKTNLKDAYFPKKNI